MRASAVVLIAVSGLVGRAVTTPNYIAPIVKDSEPAIVISRAAGLKGAACLANVMIDGKLEGTVANGERLHVPVPPGDYLVRWDSPGGGVCEEREDLAHRIVTVKGAPLMLSLEVDGLEKALIPIIGVFLVSPTFRIAIEGESK